MTTDKSIPTPRVPTVLGTPEKPGPAGGGTDPAIPDSDLKDWPQTLRLNAASCMLAQALYYGRAEAFELSVPHWDGLDPEVRRLWIERAAGILEDFRPRPRVSALFTQAARAARQTWGPR